MRAVYMVSQVAMELRAGMWPLAGGAPGPAVYHPRLVSSNSQAFQQLMTSLTRSDRPDLTTTVATLPSCFIVELMPPNGAPDATRRQLMHSSAASIWPCEITRFPFALWSLSFGASVPPRLEADPLVRVAGAVAVRYSAVTKRLLLGAVVKVV